MNNYIVYELRKELHISETRFSSKLIECILQEYNKKSAAHHNDGNEWCNFHDNQFVFRSPPSPSVWSSPYLKHYFNVNYRISLKVVITPIFDSDKYIYRYEFIVADDNDYVKLLFLLA